MSDDLKLKRKLTQYSNCSPDAIAQGSSAQMMYFVADAKHDIAILSARIEAQEAEIARLRKEASENNFKRQINIEFDGDDILICDGDHHRSEKCEFVRYVPAYRANQAESALARIAAIENKEYGGDYDEIDEAREIARHFTERN